MHDISNIDLFSYITGIRPADEPSRRRRRRSRVAPRASLGRLVRLLALGVRRRQATATS